MFTYATATARTGVQRVYYYNCFGIETGGCGSACPFDAGLVDPDGTPRPVYGVVQDPSCAATRAERRRMGDPGLEPGTSSLSEKRSNRLS